MDHSGWAVLVESFYFTTKTDACQCYYNFAKIIGVHVYAFS